MRWVVAVAPAQEPVSLDEARRHLRDPDATQNPLIESLIAAARQHIEKVCERALMPQTWRGSLDAFPDGEISLPGGLVRSITTVAYTDATGAGQTLSAGTGYQADLDSQPARLLPPAAGGSWPATQSDKANAVQITYEVGYIDSGKVPAAIKAALLLIVADLFELREAGVLGTTVQDNPAVNRLLLPYKRVVP
jgi:uncharacterized phiE125 gp8 family phage protein